MSERLDPDRLAALWDYEDPAASETRLRTELARTDPGSARAAELRTQVARALGLQGRFTDGQLVLSTVRSTDPRVRARVCLEDGRLLNSAGEAARAVPRFAAAAEHARAAGDDALLADALHMLAIADLPSAERWTVEGLAVAERSTDPHARRWRGALHTNLGWHRHDAGAFADALRSFEAALTAYTEDGTAEQVHAAWWAIGRCLRSLGRRDDALAVQRRLAAADPSDEYVAAELAELEGGS